MKTELTRIFTDSGFNPELAEIKANEVLEIVIKWLTERDVNRATVNRNHICDVLPELHSEKLVTLFDEKEPF